MEYSWRRILLVVGSAAVVFVSIESVTHEQLATFGRPVIDAFGNEIEAERT